MITQDQNAIKQGWPNFTDRGAPNGALETVKEPHPWNMRVRASKEKFGALISPKKTLYVNRNMGKPKCTSENQREKTRIQKLYKNYSNRKIKILNWN